MPKFKAKVSGGRALARYLRDAKKAQERSKSVDIGFFPESRYPDGDKLPVAAVAAFNEFGTETRPEVPFMRSAIAGAGRELVPILKAGINPKTMVVDERTASLVGEAMKGRIQAGIVSAKLVDTKRMLKSVGVKVRDANDP